MATPQSKNRSSVPRVAVVGVTLAVVALLAAGLVSLVQHALQAERRNEARNHLRGILHELHIFNEHKGRLPHAIERDDAGNVTHGWRFLAIRMLLGDVVQCGFYGQEPWPAHEEPWDGPGNKVYFDGPHRNYPGSPTSFIDPTRPGDRTRFVAVTGPGTAFDGDATIDLNNVPSDAILVVEVRNSEQHWMEPGGDLSIESMPQYIDTAAGQGISGHDPDGFLVGFASGEVWLLSNEVPFAELARFFTLKSARENSKDDLLGPYRL